MDWRTTTFDWNQARAFLAAAEEGSFSAAARALGLTQPTLGRQVAALEEELGVTLFERVGRKLVPTGTGLALVEHARTMCSAASQLSLVAAGRSVTLEGRVGITASELVAARLLPPVVDRIRREYPMIEVDIDASIHAADLLQREADIAIRNFRPTEPELFATRGRDIHARLYASVAYLESLGNPSTVEELSKAEFIGFDRGPALMDGLNAMGLSLTPENFRVVTESQLVQWELVKQGRGICMMMEEVGEPEPLVVRVLDELPSLSAPTWITSHRELHTSRRVRVVFDMLVDALGS